MFVELARRLMMLFRRRRFDADLDEEMRLHRELREQDEIERGLSAGEAHYAALRRFGNDLVLREESRDMWGWNWLENLMQDVRFGLRMLRKNPGFTTVAVLTLALGIGANTAMFSVIEAVLLRPLPFHHPTELVRVASLWRRDGVTTTYSSSPPDFFDWRDQNRSFSSMFAFFQSDSALTGQGEAKHARVVMATAGLFSTLEAHPILGREFLAEENRQGANHVAVLSYGMWQADFGGLPAAIGKTILLDSEPYTVIGVMPADFNFPLQSTDLYVPIGFDDKVMTQRGAHYLGVIGRLKGEVSLAQANDDLEKIMGNLRKLYPEKDEKWDVHADYWSNALVNGIRPALLVLLGAVGVLALIACANVSNLLLARATARHREFALRRAMGARRWWLVRQTLIEGLLLALLAVGASLLVAHGALAAIVRFGPRDIPRLSNASLNPGVLIFALGVGVASALFFGLIPALRFSAAGISGLLRISASSSREAGRARSALVIAEVALSMMLLSGAGLLVRSFVRLSSVDPGFNPKGILTLDISVPDVHYKTSLALQNYWDDVMGRLRQVPGVTSVAAVSPLPMSGDDFSSSFGIEGRTIAEKDEPSAEVRVASPGYFRTMGIPLRQGRLFEDTDRLGAARVVLISETAARMFFPAGDALGHTVVFGARGGYERNRGEIVGLVGDVRHFGLDAPIPPTFYVPLAQAGIDGATVVMRASGLPATLAQPARRLAQGIDRDTLVGEPVLMETLAADSLGTRRFYMLLLGAFAMLALTLASVGLFGVIAYSVAQRTREIGIRMALGASRREVLSMVMSEGLRFSGLGLAAGLFMAWSFDRALKGLLVGVSTTDPLTMLATAATLLFAALLASCLPAWRATKVDPMVALRYE